MTTATITPYGTDYHARLEQRENRTRHPDGYPGIYNTCICCGRKAGGPKGFWALVVDGGAAFGDPRNGGADDDTVPGFMGLYPIGTTCKRKLPKGWTLKTSDIPWAQGA